MPNVRVLLRPLPEDARKPRPKTVLATLLVEPGMLRSDSRHGESDVDDHLTTSTGTKIKLPKNAQGNLEFTCETHNGEYVYRLADTAYFLRLIHHGAVVKEISEHLPLSVAGIVLGYLE